MKKIVPFTKEIEFKTMISKITSISLEHTLSVNDNNTISGHFILEGTYKMTQASQIDEEFSYKIPVEIQIDDKYETKDIILDIDDFTYEIINEEQLKLNISLCIDKLEEKTETLKINEASYKELEGVRNSEVIDDLFLDTSEKTSLESNYNINENNGLDIDNNTKKETKTYEVQNNDIINNNDSVNSLFASFNDNAETFKSYSVYIVKESDTLDLIMKKYSVDKEMLDEYNDLSEIKTGSKIIIPCAK